jgi:hypothetical protein
VTRPCVSLCVLILLAVPAAGHHVIHCYAAANEPYEIWEGLARNSPEYKQLKKERAEVSSLRG